MNKRNATTYVLAGGAYIASYLALAWQLNTSGDDVATQSKPEPVAIVEVAGACDAGNARKYSGSYAQVLSGLDKTGCQLGRSVTLVNQQSAAFKQTSNEVGEIVHPLEP